MCPDYKLATDYQTLVRCRAVRTSLLAAYAGIWRRARLSRESIRRYQDRQVSRLVRHAWYRVPYYRQLLTGAGIGPDDIRSVDDLARIPVTRHRDLQGVALEERVARGTDPAKCILRATSGSTGEPLRLLRTRAEEYLLFGLRLRAQILSGLKSRHRRVKLGSIPTRLLPHRIGLYRASNISLDLGPVEIFRQLSILRPEVIYGIPNMFELLLAMIPREQLAALRPELIFSGAELLSSSTRRELESLFKCPVVDFYGSHEFNLIAWQCIRCGLFHTVDDGAIVEVLSNGQPAKPGEDGEVIGTALHSYAMPLIRLELGDIVRVPSSPPACEIGFGVIERIQGRAVDFLPMPDGSVLSPYDMIDEANMMSEIRQFQIVQVAPDRIRLLYIPRQREGPEASARIAARFRSILPQGLQVEAEAVSEIPRTAAGKRRLVQAFHPADRSTRS